MAWPKGKKRKGPTTRHRHGYHALRHGLDALARRGELLDERTEVGRALAAWRAQLVSDLGGEDALSTAERALVDVAVRDRLLLESVDAWILAQDRVVNGTRRCLYPVVEQRMRLADSVAKRLAMLGLRRRERPIPSLAEYLAARASSAAQADADARLEPVAAEVASPEPPPPAPDAA
jgi:hypothetical protein